MSGQISGVSGQVLPMVFQVWMSCSVGAVWPLAPAPSAGPESAPAAAHVRPAVSLRSDRYAVCEFEDPFETSAFPAVSADLRWVVTAASHDDGLRGNPNLRIEVREVGSRDLVHVQNILSANTGQMSCAALIERTRENVKDTNAWLARRKWVPPPPEALR